MTGLASNERHEAESGPGAADRSRMTRVGAAATDGAPSGEFEEELFGAYWAKYGK